MSDWEINCYGVSESHLENTYNSPYVKMVGVDMFVAGILSDCQHILEHSDDKEAVRHLLNQAKFYLSKQFEEKCDAEPRAAW